MPLPDGIAAVAVVVVAALVAVFAFPSDDDRPGWALPQLTHSEFRSMRPASALPEATAGGPPPNRSQLLPGATDAPTPHQ